MIPPISNADATVIGLNKYSSIYFPSTAPKTSAGKTPAIVFFYMFHVSVFSNCVLLLPKGNSLCQKLTITDRIVPSWITISNVFAKLPVNSTNSFTKPNGLLRIRAKTP